MLLHTLSTWIKKLLNLKQSTKFLHKAIKRFLNYFTKKLGLKSIINNLGKEIKFKSNTPSA